MVSITLRAEPHIEDTFDGKAVCWSPTYCHLECDYCTLTDTALAIRVYDYTTYSWADVPKTHPRWKQFYALIEEANPDFFVHGRIEEYA